MGLSNFPAAASGGLLPALVMNTVLCAALILRSLLGIVGFIGSDSGFEDAIGGSGSVVRERRIANTQYKLLRGGGGGQGGDAVECCVCLCRFEGEEYVSELFCRHLFHRACLDKWFDCYDHVTCPLCRSIC